MLEVQKAEKLYDESKGSYLIEPDNDEHTATLIVLAGVRSF